MDLSATIIAVFTSAGVSTATTFLFQAYFSKRIEHGFARKLEEYKTDLAVRLHAEHGIATRRLEAYPKIVELCYRTRNMARDLIAGAQHSTALLHELGVRARELEEYVFRFRIDLEADHMFLMVHRHKNLVLHFFRVASEPVLEESEEDRVDDLLCSYTDIDESYAQVVNLLSGVGVYHQH
ncbi:MAG: hypothetical protein FD174_312 [Geobacteraceae bacterium]|nr:MAG: hypothetical protein FD174_312 [Geobacteraceae bacterium]